MGLRVGVSVSASGVVVVVIGGTVVVVPGEDIVVVVVVVVAVVVIGGTVLVVVVPGEEIVVGVGRSFEVLLPSVLVVGSNQLPLHGSSQLLCERLHHSPSS